jgi:hypothetical protein
MKARTATTAIALAAFGLLASSIPAQANTPPNTEHFVLLSTRFGQNPSPVSAAGPINGLGEAQQQYPNNANDYMLTFNGGTGASGAVELSTHITGQKFTNNKKACISHATYTGTWTVIYSVGAYVGTTGHGTFNQTNVQLACPTTPTTSPLFASTATITFTGPLTLSKQPG